MTIYIYEVNTQKYYSLETNSQILLNSESRSYEVNTQKFFSYFVTMRHTFYNNYQNIQLLSIYIFRIPQTHAITVMAYT